MFLHYVNENERVSFLRLAVLLASSDGDVAREEKRLIGEFVRECGETLYDVKSDRRSVAEVLTSLSAAKPAVKKAIFIELSAVALADNIYEEVEKDFLEQVRTGLQLESDFVPWSLAWVKRVNELYREAADLLV